MTPASATTSVELGALIPALATGPSTIPVTLTMVYRASRVIRRSRSTTPVTRIMGYQASRGIPTTACRIFRGYRTMICRKVRTFRRTNCPRSQFRLSMKMNSWSGLSPLVRPSGRSRRTMFPTNPVTNCRQLRRGRIRDFPLPLSPSHAEAVKLTLRVKQ